MVRNKSRLNNKSRLHSLTCKTRPFTLGKVLEVLPVTILIIKCYGDLGILGDGRHSIDTQVNHSVCNHMSHLSEQGVWFILTIKTRNSPKEGKSLLSNNFSPLTVIIICYLTPSFHLKLLYSNYLKIYVSSINKP